MATHTLIIPLWHPPKVNELYSGHWTRRAKLKRQALELVTMYARMAGIPKAEGKRRVGLTITLGPRQRGGDVDSYHKSLLDCLTHCGLIRDDSPAWCEIEPVVYEHGVASATTIILEDLTC